MNGQGFELMQTPLPSSPGFTASEKVIIRRLSNKNNNEEVLVTEHLRNSNLILDALCVDFVLATEGLALLQYTASASFTDSSISSSSSSSSRFDFFSIAAKQFDTIAMCVINAGFTRRAPQPTEAHPFVFAVRWHNILRHIGKLGKEVDRWNEVANLLSNFNFRAYLCRAKAAWHAVDNYGRLANFYRTYPKYDNSIDYTLNP
jgi:hypothetical protein